MGCRRKIQAGFWAWGSLGTECWGSSVLAVEGEEGLPTACEDKGARRTRGTRSSLLDKKQLLSPRYRHSMDRVLCSATKIIKIHEYNSYIDVDLQPNASNARQRTKHRYIAVPLHTPSKTTPALYMMEHFFPHTPSKICTSRPFSSPCWGCWPTWWVCWGLCC